MVLLRARTFRPARLDDLDRLVEIHMASYADPRGTEARRRNFLHNPLGSFERDLWVCSEGDRIVGHAFLFSLRTHFCGRAVPVGGVASVGVAPEARGAGVATAMLEHLHGASQGRGDVLTILYAFRQGFYVRSGYAPVTPSQRLVFAPSAVPVAWRSDGVHAATDRRAIEKLWLEHASTGMLERPLSLWDHHWSNERRHVFHADGGYVAYELVQTEAHAETRLMVHELVGTDAARRQLVGFLGAQADHVSEIELEVQQDDPLALALVDPDRRRFGTLEVEHATGMLVAGPMIRVTSIERAIEARGASVSFSIAGERHGRGPLVETDRATLGVLLFGGWKLSEAVRLGLAKSEAPDEALIHPRWYGPDTF